MFTIYHSNQLDILKTLITILIANKPLNDPFKPEIILVQSNGMAQWMQIELASQFNIAANINFLLPASFIWQMFIRVLSDIPDENSFTKPLMTWRLMMLIPRLYKRSNFITISKYLTSDHDKRKIFQFSARIADIFDQYLVYRPDWLDIWQRGEVIKGLSDDQYWQSTLWRALISETKKSGEVLCHRANLYQRFIKILTKSKTRPPGLPDRVFVCGISLLPPAYLHALQALGQHIDIHLMFTNPCRYYWGDIYDNTFLVRLLNRHHQHLKKKTKQENFLHPKQDSKLFKELIKNQQIINPLLASWGKQGQDNLYLLTQMDNTVEINAFVEPKGNNLLNLLKRDILMLENYSVINNFSFQKKNKKRLLKLNDYSLSLHICHSPQREVEVLHDNLLAMIEEDSTLNFRDIIVMVADIDNYTSAIQAVFNNASRSYNLPFAISDRKARYSHPILQAFINLLELPSSRFTAEQILALLEVPALAARFNINEQELQLLHLWVAESGIRWGLDDNTLCEFMVPITSQHTWQFGLNRMLLGYAMDSESGSWQSILPYDKSSGLASLVGQLAELLMRLRYWRDQLKRPRSLSAWLDCAHKIIEDFFIFDDNSEVALSLIKNQWQQIVQYGLKVGYNQMIPVTILKDELTNKLNHERVSQRFLAGAINFCTLMPMRSIPFKVVCLLGMNDGVYPRTVLPTIFDLMVQNPRRGDRNRRDDDRYLFLEALLSAQQRLYISFVGRSIQDNTLRYPSVLVNELSDYIEQSFYLPGDEYTDNKSSAERVRAHLWQCHTRTPFAPENFLPNNKYQSFASEWLPAANSEGKSQSDFPVPLISIPNETLNLDKLIKFYRHPVRAWFTQRLAISFQQSYVELTSYEPFIMDNMTRYQLNKQILNTLINNKSIDKLFFQIRASGILPYGSFGELHWIKQCQEMNIIYNKINKWLLKEKHNCEVLLKINNITLYGWLLNVQKNGLIRWHPGILSVQDGLTLWIEHLIYCAIGGKGYSWMFGTRGEWHFPPLSTNYAKKILFSLISGYFRGMESPLLLLPRMCNAWISQCYNPITRDIYNDDYHQQKAKKKLIKVWEGNDYIPGENRDPYIQRLIYQLKEKHIEEIILAAKQYLLLPSKFNLSSLSK